MRSQGSKTSLHTVKGSNWTWQANLAVLAHSYADCGLWLSSMGANHEPWRWGSDYCAEQQLWGSLADPMDVGQHQNNTTQNVTQTFHWWTNKTSIYLMPTCPGSKSCLVWHTVKETRHTHEAPRPNIPLMERPDWELLVTCCCGSYTGICVHTLNISGILHTEC